MIFTATLNQMLFLFLLIAIGYVLAKLNLVPEKTENTLSKLENYIFLPALILGNFISNFTIDKLNNYKSLIIGSIVVEIFVIAISFLVSRAVTKDSFLRNIFLYGLCFSNFGFMGNAVVSALFPDIFAEYVIFTLVLWSGIYLWGAPVLLIGDNDEKMNFKKAIKNFLNPMFIAMLIGMVIGIAKIRVPAFIDNVIVSLGDCMSPIAMLLTGMTVARSKLKEMVAYKSIYIITIFRLIVYPLIFVFISKFIPESLNTFVICTLVSLAMPLGLNTIVIPSAYGKDTRIASGMALVSHLFACITIPVMFLLLFK